MNVQVSLTVKMIHSYFEIERNSVGVPWKLVNHSMVENSYPGRIFSLPLKIYSL